MMNKRKQHGGKTIPQPLETLEWGEPLDVIQISVIRGYGVERSVRLFALSIPIIVVAAIKYKSIFICCGILPVGLAVFGVGYAIQQLAQFDRHYALVFHEGFSYTRGRKTVVVAWGEIEAVTLYRIGNDIQLTVARVGKSPLQVLPSVDQVEAWKDVLGGHFAYRKPALQEALINGETVHFGPLQLAADTLTIGTDALRIADIIEIGLHDEVVIARLRQTPSHQTFWFKIPCRTIHDNLLLEKWLAASGIGIYSVPGTRTGILKGIFSDQT